MRSIVTRKERENNDVQIFGKLFVAGFKHIQIRLIPADRFHRTHAKSLRYLFNDARKLTSPTMYISMRNSAALLSCVMTSNAFTISSAVDTGNVSGCVSLYSSQVIAR